MKKIYLLASLALTVNAFAQSPTISSTSLPHVGYSYNDLNDSTSTQMASFTVTPGSGTAQTWNYASAFITTYTSSTVFVAPSSVAGASNFPTANLAITSGTGTATANAFYTASSSGLVMNGYYSSSTTFTDSPNEVIIPTPFTCGNSTVNNFTWSISGVSGAYSYLEKFRSTRTITADAYGSLTTPTGSYPNTLRIKTYQVDADSLFYGLTGGPLAFVSKSRDSSLTYMWTQNTASLLLMTINMNGAGNKTTSASYLSSFGIGLENHATPFAAMSLYPNPASDATSLSYENKNATHVTIELFDLNGRFIAILANENQPVGKQTLPIDTKALQLNAGLYFVRISSPSGSETVKLSVN